MSALRLQMSGGRERRRSPIGVKNRKVINLPARWNKSAEVTRVQTETRKPVLLQKEAEKTGTGMTSSSKNTPNIIREQLELTTMVPLDEVARFTWNKEKARRLKLLRGEMPRRTLETRLKELGYDYTHEYVRTLENAIPDSISRELVTGFCQVFGVEMAYFFTTAQISVDVIKVE